VLVPSSASLNHKKIHVWTVQCTRMIESLRRQYFLVSKARVCTPLSAKVSYTLCFVLEEQIV
jgi:hypothetical protein